MVTIINVEFGRHRSVSETVNVANGTTEIVETQSGNELTDEQRYELAKKAERVHRAKMAASKRRLEPVQPLKDDDSIQKVANYLKATGKYAMRNWLLFIVGISTGLRCSDIIVLTFGHFFDELGHIKDVIVFNEKKTGKKKVYNISNMLKNALREYVEALPEPYQLDQYIFYSNKKNTPHINVETVRQLLVKATDKALNEEIVEYNEQLANSNDANNDPCKTTGNHLSSAEATVSSEACIDSECRSGATMTKIRKQMIHAGSHTMRKTYALRALKAAEEAKKKNIYAPAPLTVVQALLNHSSELMTLRYLGIDVETRANVERTMYAEFVF